MRPGHRVEGAGSGLLWTRVAPVSVLRCTSGRNKRQLSYAAKPLLGFHHPPSGLASGLCGSAVDPSSSRADHRHGPNPVTLLLAVLVLHDAADDFVPVQG